MDSSILINSLNEDNYSEYIENILNIFRLSNKESYILLNSKIESESCVLNLSIINSDGESKRFSDITFKCDSSFYSNFLDVLVSKVYNECNIVTVDSVNLDNDNYVAFRMITENNDLFTVDGLTEEYAMHLISLCSDVNLTNQKSNSKLLDNVGFSNISMSVLIVFVLIMILSVIYLIITL